MQTLIIYKSIHHMSTEKVAKAMADAMSAKLVKVEDVKPEELAVYDLIGFGSGIYNLKVHKAMTEFIDKMPRMDKKVFVFTTTGNFRDVNHKLIKEKLTEKGCEVVGEFTCYGEFSPLGFIINLPGPLVLFGGKNKGHPDAKDLDDARTFAKKLISST